jgi:hypothetical protein
MSLNFIIAWKNDKWCNKGVLIWRFTVVLIKINYGQIGDQKGSFIQQTQYFRQSDQQWKPMFFRTELIFTGFVRWTGMFRNLWLLLTHKPVGLLTCDILEVCGRYYWPVPSGLWLSSKTAFLYSFTSISFLTTSCSFTLICV